jgi:Uncharacterized protein involved in formation of curli polymers
VKRKSLVCIILFIFILISAAPIFGAKQLYRIAVLPFDDRSLKNRWWGNDFKVGQEVSSELVTALLDTQQFRLIEREQVDRVLSEQKWSAVNVDSDTATEFGKMLGVKYLVMGHVTEFSFDNDQRRAFVGPYNLGIGVRTNTARVVIDARMVDTTTAEIFLGATGVGEKTRRNVGIATMRGQIRLGDSNFAQSELGQALRDAVTSVASQFASKTYSAAKDEPLTGLVAYISPATVIINIGSTNGVEAGMTFSVKHVVQEVRDPLTKEVIDEIGEEVAKLTVVEAKEKASVCRIDFQKGEIAVNDKVRSTTQSETSTPTPAPSQAPRSDPEDDFFNW